MRRALALALIAFGVFGVHASSRAEVTMRSDLALALVESGPAGQAPVLILAQRVIDRSWGLPEGTPPPAPVSGMLSEGRALALSAVVPGAGQLYGGELSGLWFALAELAGWTSHWVFIRDADRGRDRANAFAGVPADTGSAWSFERWQRAGAGRDPVALEALYAGDRDAFYNLIAREPGYIDGWAGPDPARTRADFQHLRDLSDGSVRRARACEKVIWLNHVVAAFDALRAARIHNLPIRRNLELRIKSSWRSSGPTMTAVIERRF